VHSLWQSPLLNTSNNVVDGVATPLSLGTSWSNLERLKKYEIERLLHSKASLDFSLALQSCLNTTPHAKYVALIEGDVLFSEGWYARARTAITQIEQKDSSWLDLRLFRPDSNSGWAERKWLGNNVPQIILGIDLAMVTAALALRYRRAYGGKLANSPWLSNASLIVLCLITVPTVIVVFYATGKASMSTFLPHSGFYQQDWGCCTQSIILPIKNVQPLIDTLQSRTEEAAPDSLVMQHARREGLTRYVLDPVAVQHRGVVGSVISPGRDEQAAQGNLLWNIEYEDLDPKRLRSGHIQMVRKLFSGESFSLGAILK
jgi:hypothetical protein